MTRHTHMPSVYRLAAADAILLFRIVFDLLDGVVHVFLRLREFYPHVLERGKGERSLSAFIIGLCKRAVILYILWILLYEFFVKFDEFRVVVILGVNRNE